jgi:hypothetical protein
VDTPAFASPEQLGGEHLESLHLDVFGPDVRPRLPPCQHIANNPIRSCDRSLAKVLGTIIRE